MAIIQIKGLSKVYRVYEKKEGLLASVKGLFRRQHREVHAVRDIDLEVEAGEFVAFLGPNGAGKTTTLKLLSGVIHPTSGTATVLGHVPWKRDNRYRRKFALVMGQKNQLWWDLPAQESFRLHQQIYRIDTQQYDRTIDELTGLLGVRKLLKQPVRELSLGERMKMELTAALLHNPEILFLDEPTIGLDVVAQHNIQQFLKHYQQERKITILLTSHYMKDVEALCRRLVIVAHGRVHYDGSLSGIIGQANLDRLVTVQLADGESTAGLEQYGPVEEVNPPQVTLRLSRDDVPAILSRILDQRRIVDVVVEEPPLEEVLANVFTRFSEENSEDDPDRLSTHSSDPAVASPTRGPGGR